MHGVAAKEFQGFFGGARDPHGVARALELQLLQFRNAGVVFHEEDRLGSIEPGKLGDLVVLSDDFFDAKKVPDAAIRKLRSVLTVVDGKVIYNSLNQERK